MSRPLALALCGLLVAAPAAARERQVTPYIEASQVLTADLSGNGDVLTYTSLAAGVDASITSRRVELQASYRYEYRFGWDRPRQEDSVHSGLARAAVTLGRGLQIEGGALATRARSDVRGAAPGAFGIDQPNLSQVFAAYVGPTLATRAGPVTVNAAYRFGYVKVESPDQPGLLPGASPLDYYDDSTSHMAMASASVRAGEILPIGLTVSGAWNRENVSQLDQRYDGKFARVDAVLPVTPALAVTAGAGYEEIEISQRDALLTPAGQPAVDGNGRFVTDPASPRRIAYETDGLFWDAGVIWRPSRRTTLTARVGRRYESTTYLGSLSYQIDEGSGFQVGVYDSVQSFGRGLNNALATLPTAFNTRPDPFGDQFGGCVFGSRGDNAGACLNPILGAVSTSQFRSRGVDAVYSANAGPYRFGVGAGYTNRAFLVPRRAQGFGLDNVSDAIWYGQLFAGRSLSPRSSVDANAFINYFDSGVAGTPDVLGGGATGSYSYSFGRFGATASVGVYAFDQGAAETDVSAQGLVGMRYSF